MRRRRRQDSGAGAPSTPRARVPRSGNRSGTSGKPSNLSSALSLVPDLDAWRQRSPVEARCGCRVDFVALGRNEYALVFSPCERGESCQVVRYVAWEIDRTRAEVSAL